jgi:hypothetical protein
MAETGDIKIQRRQLLQALLANLDIFVPHAPPETRQITTGIPNKQHPLTRPKKRKMTGAMAWRMHCCR